MPFCEQNLVALARVKKSLSLVFAGENLRSPISTFGHTFLVFHNEEEPEPDSVVLEFLGVTENITFSSVKALIGTLPGKFRWTCLVEKELLYDLENRDLWIYKTALAESEKSSLIDEAAAAKDEYGFVRNNCADRIHDLLLRAARKPTPFEFIHEPIKGVRYLQQQGVVASKGSQQLSSLKKLRLAYNVLSAEERDNFDSILAGGKSFSPSRSLATAISRYTNFQYRREGSRERRELLFEFKYQFVDESTESQYPAGADDVSRSTSLRSLNISSSLDQLELRFSPGGQNRWSFHEGAFVHSDLEYFTIAVGIESEKVFLRELTFLRLDSLLGGDRFEADSVRYIDLSYEETNEAGLAQRDIVAQFGSGIGFAPSGALAVGAMPLFGIRNSNLSSRSGDAITGEFGYRLKFSFVDSVLGAYSFVYAKLFESPETSRLKGVVDLIPYRSAFWSFGGRYTFTADGGTGAIVLNHRF